MSDDEQRNSRKRPADFEEFDDGEETKYESEDEVIDEDGNVAGDLDLSHAATQAWLVKIPKFLADQWSGINQEGVDLGKVRIINPSNPNDPTPPQFQLILPANEHTVNIPKTYSLKMNPAQVNNTFVFTEPTGPHPKPPHDPGYPTGKATSILATIKHECSVTPHAGSAESDPAGGRGGQFLPGVGIRNGFIQKKAKVQMDQKTTRMPRNELVDMLFAAFEQFPYWSFKGLVEHVKQPQSYLKEVLNEIGEFIKKGPYTSKYQLKSEFVGAGGRGGSSSSAKAGKSAIRGEDETTFNPAAVGLAAGESATSSSTAAADPDLQEALDDDDEDLDDDDDDEMVEVAV
ncbi:hypothetical protein BGX20_011409 [Mortierella sp. AD010]|nr:hypothetical protein BGX20_011409 [Mortierella sp. AD010]